MTKLTQLLNEITQKVKSDSSYSQAFTFEEKFNLSVQICCDYFEFTQDENIKNYIRQEINSSNLEELANYFCQDQTETKTQNNFVVTILARILDMFSQINKLIQPQIGKLIHQLPKGTNDMNIDIKIIVFLALVAIAVFYILYQINQSKKQQQDNRKSKVQHSGIQLETNYESNVESRTKSTANKYLLILVISASETTLIESLRKKQQLISSDDCERLYKATEYLCQDTQSNLQNNVNELMNINLTSELDSDVHLVIIELEEKDERFNKNVSLINRHDAFRQLVNKVNKIEVSNRLPVGSYKNIPFYRKNF